MTTTTRDKQGATTVTKGFPTGWEKTAPKPLPVGVPMRKGIGPIQPLHPIVLAACLLGMRDRGEDDLADMVGVTPADIRTAEAARLAAGV